MAQPEKRIGIRELKSTLSECGRKVKAGRTIVVTDHGQPVARIIPEAMSLRTRVDALRDGWRDRVERPFAATSQAAGKVRGDKTVADLIIENRV